MPTEIKPIILGVEAWSTSCAFRYLTKAFLKSQLFKRIKKEPENFAQNIEHNIIDTNFLKKLAPLAIGVLRVSAGITTFAVSGNDQLSLFLTSFGAAHLIENIVYYQGQLRAKPKK